MHPLFQLVVTRAEVLANMDEAGSAYTSKDMFAGSKAEVDFVQVGIENILRNCLIICPLPSPKIPT